MEDSSSFGISWHSIRLAGFSSNVPQKNIGFLLTGMNEFLKTVSVHRNVWICEQDLDTQDHPPQGSVNTCLACPTCGADSCESSPPRLNRLGGNFPSPPVNCCDSAAIAPIGQDSLFGKSSPRCKVVSAARVNWSGATRESLTGSHPTGVHESGDADQWRQKCRVLLCASAGINP